MKKCSTCRWPKELATGFYRDASARDGYHSQCKTCMDAGSERWRKSHPEQRRDTCRRWDQQHRSAASAMKF